MVFHPHCIKEYHSRLLLAVTPHSSLASPWRRGRWKVTKVYSPCFDHLSRTHVTLNFLIWKKKVIIKGKINFLPLNCTTSSDLLTLYSQKSS